MIENNTNDFANLIVLHQFKYNGDGTYSHTKFNTTKINDTYLLPDGTAVNGVDFGKLINNTMYSLEYDIIDFIYMAIEYESDILQNRKSDLSKEAIDKCFDNIEKLTKAYLSNNIT